MSSSETQPRTRCGYLMFNDVNYLLYFILLYFGFSVQTGRVSVYNESDDNQNYS